MIAGRKRILFLILCVLSSAAIALAGPKDHGHGKGKGRNPHETVERAPIGVSIFVERDRDLIRNHFRTGRGDLPPGLAKRGGALPPGLAKQLRRNGHLPPGLEKRLEPFPVILERRLPPLRPGLVRGFIGGRAVIMNSKTGVILDIFAVL